LEGFLRTGDWFVYIIMGRESKLSFPRLQVWPCGINKLKKEGCKRDRECKG